MELNHLVQDDHRVTAGYLTVRSHSLEPGRSQTSPGTPEARRSSSSAGSLSDRWAGCLGPTYESGAPRGWGIDCLRVLSSSCVARAWHIWLIMTGPTGR